MISQPKLTNTICIWFLTGHIWSLRFLAGLNCLISRTWKIIHIGVNSGWDTFFAIELTGKKCPNLNSLLYEKCDILIAQNQLIGVDASNYYYSFYFLFLTMQ